MLAPSHAFRRDFPTFWFRVTACHAVTYFAAGLAAYAVLGYRDLFQSPSLACYMRAVDSGWVAAGPALQVFRGIVIALAIFPFRSLILNEPRGWLPLWGLLAGLSVFSTSGAAPGSLEGFVFTRLTPAAHLQGLPEVLLQNLAFALLLTTWYRKESRYWNYAFGAGLMVIVLLSLAGVFLPRPEAYK